MTQPLGLPRNAWLNAALYSMSGGFPNAAKTGDRIHRPDLESRWFTYNGTGWVGDPTIKSGTTTTVYTNPIIGDRLYRTDLGAWYTYNGSTWLADGGTTYTPPATTGSAFPGSPTNGQRFLRTDTGTVGGTTPGKWYTYNSTNALWAPDYLTGTLTTAAVSVAATGLTTLGAVPFGHTSGSGWAGTPNIFLNNNMTTANGEKVILRAGNATSTQFTVYGSSSNGVTASIASGTVIGWYAVRL